MSIAQSPPVAPVLWRPSELIQHEESQEIGRVQFRIRAILRAGQFIGSWKCECHENGISCRVPTIEEALERAGALANGHAARCRVGRGQ